MTIFDEVRGTGCQSFDPYDVWSSPYGVVIRLAYYSGHVFGKRAAIALALADWLTPGFSRRIIRAAKRSYPIVAAQRILMLDVENRLTRELSGELASYLAALSTRCSQKQAWGSPGCPKTGFMDLTCLSLPTPPMSWKPCWSCPADQPHSIRLTRCSMEPGGFWSRCG